MLSNELSFKRQFMKSSFFKKLNHAKAKRIFKKDIHLESSRWYQVDRFKGKSLSIHIAFVKLIEN